MMKKTYLLAFFILYYANPLQAQEIADLNRYKYVIVEMLIYKNNQIDIHNVSAYVRKKFLDNGFLIIAENPESWPEDLKHNPCLTLYCNINTTSRLFSKYKLEIELINCRDDLVYSKMGSGDGYTYEEAFQDAADKAFSGIDRFNYRYDEALGLKPKKITGEKSEEELMSLQNYFNSGQLDPLEGIYKEVTGKLKYTLGIKKSGKDFIAVVLESKNGLWEPSEIKAYITPSSLKNIYSVKWIRDNKTSYETIATLDDDDKFIIELKEGDNNKNKVVLNKL